MVLTHSSGLNYSGGNRPNQNENENGAGYMAALQRVIFGAVPDSLKRDDPLPGGSRQVQVASVEASNLQTVEWMKQRIQLRNRQLRQVAPEYLVMPLMVKDFEAKRVGKVWVHRAKFATPFDFSHVKEVQLSDPPERCPHNPCILYRTVLLITCHQKKTCLSFPYLYNGNVVVDNLDHWGFVNGAGKEVCEKY